jgi:hypothetical protein
MTNKAEAEQVYFHSYAKHPRLNNPTLYLGFNLASPTSLAILYLSLLQPLQGYF